jgi:hypothetical protein
VNLRSCAVHLCFTRGDCSSGRQARGRSSCCAPRLAAVRRRHAQQRRRCWTHDKGSTQRSGADKLSSAPAPTGQLKALQWQHVRAAGVSVTRRLAVATWQQQQGRTGIKTKASTAVAAKPKERRQTRGVNSKRPLRRGHKPAQRTVPSIHSSRGDGCKKQLACMSCVQQSQLQQRDDAGDSYSTGSALRHRTYNIAKRDWRGKGAIVQRAVDSAVKSQRTAETELDTRVQGASRRPPAALACTTQKQRNTTRITNSTRQTSLEGHRVSPTATPLLRKEILPVILLIELCQNGEWWVHSSHCPVVEGGGAVITVLCFVEGVPAEV